MKLKLKSIKEERELTYRDISLATAREDPAGKGITEKHVREIADGNSGCSLWAAVLICRALDIKLDDLVDWESIGARIKA